MTESTESARTVEPPPIPLPWQLRAARLAEGLFLPVGIFFLASIPLDEVAMLAIVGAQVAAAVAAFVGLKRRRRWAWLLAMALAALFMGRIVVNAPLLADQAEMFPGAMVYIVALVGWAFLTQLAVLLCCVTLFPGGRWRAELR